MRNTLFEHLPERAEAFMRWSWEQMEPFYQELIERDLDEAGLEAWMSAWSRLRRLVDETYARLQLANSQNTADPEAEQRFLGFVQQTYPAIQAADQKLKEKLLASGLEPAQFAIPLRTMRAEAALFRPENLPLAAEEHRLGAVYGKIFGAQTVTWDGEEVTIQGMRRHQQTPDREVRERAWRLAADRQLADREAINDLWGQFMEVRGKMARNAGNASYREYRWQQLLRFDYTPAEAARFHAAVEKVVVPRATKIYEELRQKLGADRLRPWDLDLDLYPLELPPIHAYDQVEELESRSAVIFEQVDPQLGRYFEIMRQERLLDLENRKGKAPGAFCTQFGVQGVPFVFANSVGLASDVRTVMHECGHAFHVFERVKLPYHHQWRTTMEFAEVASMAMELLTAPYMSREQGGFFSAHAAAAAQRLHLEKIMLFWPYMAVVDAFQHWVYENHELARDPAHCDAKWVELWQRFIPGQDWSGLEQERMTGWQRKLHIHRAPFYYIEYGIAQVGAIQVWRNALQDQKKAVESYRQALALGGTASIPDLYRAAGGKFALDEETLREAVDLVQRKMDELEG